MKPTYRPKFLIVPLGCSFWAALIAGLRYLGLSWANVGIACGIALIVMLLFVGYFILKAEEDPNE